MIRVGSARTNEFGGISGGQPGDQTGHECETQSWYLHEYGWVLARPRNKGVAEKMAHNMESICANPAYGYDQPRDHDGINAAKPYGYDAELVTTPTSIDCAKAIRLCALYAGIDCPDFYTATEIAVLEKTGAFDIIYDPEYTTTWERLRRGDVLCTKRQGHTVLVLDDGPLAYIDPEEGAKAYRTTGNVWMRTGPSTDYAKICVIPDEKVVASNGEAANGWAKVTYKGSTGWSSMKYLQPIEIASYIYVKAGKTARLRSTPVIGATLRYLAQDTKLLPTGADQKILGTIWYEVAYDGVIGWVSGKLLEV